MSRLATNDLPKRLGIIAGSGALPREVAEACAAANQDIFVVDLEGRASDWASGFDNKQLSLGQVGGALKALRAAGCDAVVMAGAIKRPNLRSLKTDWTGIKLMPRFTKAAVAGDDSLLRGVAAFFEEQGFRVLAPHSFLAPDALAPEGLIAGPALLLSAEAEVSLGKEILSALSRFDIGQAVAIRDARCLAIEGAEGTAAMLERVTRIDGAGGCLVKARKIQQDDRLDRPAVGPDTVSDVVQAGLKTIAVEAGGVLLLERERLEEEANRADVTLFGFPSHTDSSS